MVDWLNVFAIIGIFTLGKYLWMVKN